VKQHFCILDMHVSRCVTKLSHVWINTGKCHIYNGERKLDNDSIVYGKELNTPNEWLRLKGDIQNVAHKRQHMVSRAIPSTTEM
jgi:hypothetical protein